MAYRWIMDDTARDLANAVRAESFERLGLALDILGPHLAGPHSSGFHVWIPRSRDQATRVAMSAARQGIIVTPPDS